MIHIGYNKHDLAVLSKILYGTLNYIKNYCSDVGNKITLHAQC